MTDAPETDSIHYYWRPGCGFCKLLRHGLDKAGIETVDHDIWDDADAAATVRTYASGNETVPTVVIGRVGLVNPSTRQVLRHLEQFAPHLLPSGYEPRKPGLAARLLGTDRSTQPTR